MTKLGDDYVLPTNVNPDDLSFSCQWILSVLNKAIFKTIVALESYKFLDVASTVYSWWQYQLCDVFIEAIKPFFVGSDPRFEFILTQLGAPQLKISDSITAKTYAHHK